MRYQREAPKFDFGKTGAFGSGTAKKHKPSALEEFLRLGQIAAPAVGAVGGGLLGTFAAPGIGTAAGAGLGAAAGAGVGGLMGYGAERMTEDAQAEEDERLQREAERAARAQAALNILGGF
jgi:uncharacterized protein YcfJ